MTPFTYPKIPIRISKTPQKIDKEGILFPRKKWIYHLNLPELAANDEPEARMPVWRSSCPVIDCAIDLDKNVGGDLDL